MNLGTLSKESAAVHESERLTVLRFSPRPNGAHLIRWREWGEEAFREAETQDKPIALVITAFWCGFCQRMDETSLSTDEVATLLNALFVPVRVEESQRPDVDLRYNHNGWPTVAFLTPKGLPLLSLNYSPPEEFAGVLARVVDYHQTNREALRQVEVEAPAVVDAGSRVALSPAVVEEIAGIVEGLADREFGGYGLDLKLLHTEANDFALYLYETRGEEQQLQHVLLTLRRLRHSRTYDARDGGFFRYSSKRDWQEPHPEKLLADQAALLGNYLDAYLLSGEAWLKETAESLVDYVQGTLSPPGMAPFFAGCQDYLHGADAQRERTFILDTLVYCDANARTASALLKAWWLLGRDECRARAEAVIEALWEGFRAPRGGMYHFSDGTPRAPGLLADAVAMGQALVDAYAALGDKRYLERAGVLASEIVERHLCPEGGFYDVSETGPGHLRYPLVLLPENARAARFFIALADLAEEPRYRDRAAWALRRFHDAYREQGAFAAGYGLALSLLLSPALPVELTGRPGDEATLGLLRAARTRPRHPNLSLTLRRQAAGQAPELTLSTAAGKVGPLRRAEELTPELLRREVEGA